MVVQSALAFVLAASLSGCAYDTYGHARGNNGRATRVDRAAFDGGYRDGYDQGRRDARDGDRYNPKRHREYRTADGGRWRGGLQREYRDGFLSGYENGYRDARRGRRGRR